MNDFGNSKQPDPQPIDMELLSVNKFLILSFFSFSLYPIWWMYKSWRFFEFKDNLDIIPVMRAFFYIVFLYRLFERIKSFARSCGRDEYYSSEGLAIGYIVFGLLSRLPDPFWLVALLNPAFFIDPLQVFNQAVIDSNEFEIINDSSYSLLQKGLIVGGTIFWILVLIGLFSGVE